MLSFSAWFISPFFSHRLKSLSLSLSHLYPSFSLSHLYSSFSLSFYQHLSPLSHRCTINHRCSCSSLFCFISHFHQGNIFLTPSINEIRTFDSCNCCSILQNNNNL